MSSVIPSDSPRRWLLALLAIAALTASAALSNRAAALRPRATLEDVLYLPSPRVLKGLSLGYSGLLADIYWTRVVQYFGEKHQVRSRDYELLAPLLDITTQLDPNLMVAYEFGSVFLAQKPPEGAGQPDKAVELVERGIRANPASPANPNAWRLYMSLGFIHYIERKDYAAAASAFERGAEVSGGLPWMKAMAALMAQGAGDRKTAVFFWQRLYESTEDKLLRQNAINRLKSLKVDEDISQLDMIQESYMGRHGHKAASWQELISSGALQGIPADPTGRPYKIRSEGNFEVQRPQDFPFVTLGLPGGNEAPQRFIISPPDHAVSPWVSPD